MSKPHRNYNHYTYHPNTSNLEFNKHNALKNTRYYQFKDINSWFNNFYN